MKKKEEKKLSLGKVKIASLKKADQQKIKGGLRGHCSCTCTCCCCCC